MSRLSDLQSRFPNLCPNTGIGQQYKEARNGRRGDGARGDRSCERETKASLKEEGKAPRCPPRNRFPPFGIGSFNANPQLSSAEKSSRCSFLKAANAILAPQTRHAPANTPKKVTDEECRNDPHACMIAGLMDNEANAPRPCLHSGQLPALPPVLS